MIGWLKSYYSSGFRDVYMLMKFLRRVINVIFVYPHPRQGVIDCVDSQNSATMVAIDLEQSFDQNVFYS